MVLDTGDTTVSSGAGRRIRTFALPSTTPSCSYHLNYTSICAFAANVIGDVLAAIVVLFEESATLKSVGSDPTLYAIK